MRSVCVKPCFGATSGYQQGRRGPPARCNHRHKWRSSCGTTVGTFCCRTMEKLQKFFTAAGVWLARPVSFVAVFVYTVLWLIFDRESFDFHGAVALITLCMTLFIQRSEHRDTQAIHAKLDEILRALGKGGTEITKIDDAEPEHIEAHREGANVQDR